MARNGTKQFFCRWASTSNSDKSTGQSPGGDTSYKDPGKSTGQSPGGGTSYKDPGKSTGQSPGGGTSYKDPGKSTGQSPGGGTSYKDPGWKRMDSTAGFRAINFELFMKPNKIVMAAGLVMICGCLGYIGYLQLTTDKSKQTYMALNEQDKLEKRYRTSKWD